MPYSKYLSKIKSERSRSQYRKNDEMIKQIKVRLGYDEMIKQIKVRLGFVHSFLILMLMCNLFQELSIFSIKFLHSFLQHTIL